MQNLFRHLEHRIDDLFHGGEQHSHTHHGVDCGTAHADEHNGNRYQSFAPQTTGHAKWYVDGCSYFWAVSEALEAAQSSIYILDWWLSPELYLRRPPARNEQYRLDRMLKAAAERGVQVRVIVYKEVPQALTLNSAHTKHALEALHPNIRVFRHPDHLPSGNDLKADVQTAFKDLSLGSLDLAKLGRDAAKTLYGTSDDVVLYWAHHEKLCIVDDHLAFMGGLDMCFGRWDTNSHPIADAHPGDLDAILFPGQDYNNARVYDFEDVDKWENNKLDRTKSSRMGWSDISISLSGHIVPSLMTHFVDRWNYIYNGKYVTRTGYAALEEPAKRHHVPDSLRSTGAQLLDGMNRLLGDGAGEGEGHHRHHHFWRGGSDAGNDAGHDTGDNALHIQLTRSCTAWSAGHQTEHSVANAYIDAIGRAEHFVYMENQFFITATGDAQHPVGNQIGRAIVQRIVRAHAEQTPFAMIVCIPAVPGFAGDLHADSALGTRAIMEFQYNSISRGGHSICEELVAAGVPDPGRYLRFYNLRNYDRINTAPLMRAAESAARVSYSTARRALDDAVETGYDGYARGEGDAADSDSGAAGNRDPGAAYHRYQDAAADAARADPSLARTADSVSASYMAGGPDLRRQGWWTAAGQADATDEDDNERAAFVSEELYIHSKVLIVDDRLVICGSANLNDRSQLGSHDSEIAVVIEDPAHPVHTTMAGKPYVAAAFATSLRRQLFRKHLGLLPDQRWDQPTQNALWTGTARTNTAAFDDVFHCVPTDRVRNWDDYEQYFASRFVLPGSKEEKEADEKTKKGLSADPAKAPYGHVVPGFPGGAAAVKARLAEVRGNLVEMPLQFLVEVEDLAKEGLALNSLTDELYT